jgi:hypothetical protein
MKKQSLYSRPMFGLMTRGGTFSVLLVLATILYPLLVSPGDVFAESCNLQFASVSGGSTHT